MYTNRAMDSGVPRTKSSAWMVKNGQAAVPVTGVDSSKVDNPYLKQDGFSPELIVFVNEEGERHTDPWLMVMMYDTAAISSKGHKFEEMVLDCDYYMEARDLLLLDSQPVKSEMSLVSELYKYHAAHRNIQFSYMGETSDLVVKDVSKSTKIVGMQDRLDIVQDFDDGRMINVYGSVVWDGSPRDS